MNKVGPIVIIEDDEDDQEIMKEVFHEVDAEQELIFFTDGEQAYDYLTATNVKPFLIISDINMPRLNGFELRDKVHNTEQLKLKCIPFLFFTTSAEQQMVIDAYSKSAQGFFVKPHTYDHLVHYIKAIVDYWKVCEAPNVGA